MTDDQFWGLIHLLTLEKIEDDLGYDADEDSLDAFEEAIAALSDAEAIAFFHLLSAKLHALDTPEHHTHCRVGGGEASADVFLYARCNVLALGKTTYDQVLSTPAAFPPDLWFEDILSAADDAYDPHYETDPNADALLSYESFSNPMWSKQ